MSFREIIEDMTPSVKEDLKLHREAPWSPFPAEGYSIIHEFYARNSVSQLCKDRKVRLITTEILKDMGVDRRETDFMPTRWK